VRRSLLIAGSLAAALAGCGTTEIDEQRAEDFVQSYFTPDARSVDCPGGTEAKAGETFECSAVDSEGRRFRVTAHVVDDEGRVEVRSEDVRPE
jgi:uncharacterized lipoprotein